LSPPDAATSTFLEDPEFDPEHSSAGPRTSPLDAVELAYPEGEEDGEGEETDEDDEYRP
jgi:hypothetical protein